MDKYIHPVTQSVMDAHCKYVKWFSDASGTDDNWKDYVEQQITDRSDGKIRAFQLFFNNPEDAINCSEINCQVLAESDMKQMYPSFLNKSMLMEPHNYLFMFTCNNAVFTPGEQPSALIAGVNISL